MFINVLEDDFLYVMFKEVKVNVVWCWIEGFIYEQECSFDVMEIVVGNEGGMVGIMVGVGVDKVGIIVFMVDMLDEGIKDQMVL